MSAKTLSTALWCSVIPSVQQSCACSAFAVRVRRARGSASAGTPVTRSASSSVHGSTEAR